jgi:N6-adenosine-specific RNA methylase IME4
LKPFDLKILRTDIDKYLDSDEELQKQKQKVDYLSTTVDFLDKTIRQIGNRGFTIKNAIDWRKFTSGAI